MATQLDQQIEELENIVEKHLDPCKVTCNGSRCILPRNHTRTEPHKSLVEFLETLGAAERLRVGAETSSGSSRSQAKAAVPSDRRKYTQIGGNHEHH